MPRFSKPLASVNQPSIGKRIFDLMHDQGLTQAKLAEKANVAQSTISRIIGGRIKYPRHSVVEQIASALKVTVNDILGNTIAPPAANESNDLSSHLAMLDHHFYRIGQRADVASILADTTFRKSDRTITITYVIELSNSELE